jgi:chromosome segregation ATPase
MWEDMGQVSTLEDIQKAVENLEHEIARSIPPTEVAIAAQQRRLEKEGARLKQLSANLLAVAMALKEGLNKPSMKKVSMILGYQVSTNRLNSIKSEIADYEARLGKWKKLEADLVEMKLRQTALDAKLEGLAVGLSQTSVSPEKRNRIIKAVIDQKLSALFKNHPETERLKSEVTSVASQRDRALAEVERLRQRLEQAKTMLGDRGSR